MSDLHRDIHRARLANLQDDPPELGEAMADYCARMAHVYGTTYTEAARERYQGAPTREAHAKAAARTAIANLMRKASGAG